MEINALLSFHAAKDKYGTKLFPNVYAHQQVSGMEIPVFRVEEVKAILTEDASAQQECSLMEPNV
jgi:hypothetical protein